MLLFGGVGVGDRLHCSLSSAADVLFGGVGVSLYGLINVSNERIYSLTDTVLRLDGRYKIC